MKKRIAAVLAVLCLAVILEPTVSRAAVVPAFIAINDTLLAFNDDNMPFLNGNEYFVPSKVFEDLGIWSIGSDEEERVLVYRGASRYLEFSTRPGDTRTTDQNGEVLNWPATRRIGRRFYVPLRQTCAYFDLSYEILEISRDIIPQQQVFIVRIISSANFNGPTFIGLNRNALNAAYNEYYQSHFPLTPPSQGAPPEEEEEEPPPDYSDVRVLLSFCEISSGSAELILDLLEYQAAFGYYSCFFVSADDIQNDPGLIRRISGVGHTIGLRLTEGTLEEYAEASALLFEAAKIRTVLVSIDPEAPEGIAETGASGLIFWGSSGSSGFYDGMAVADINAMIPTESGERYSLMFSCSEDSAAVLPGVISYLRENEYTTEKITETIEAIYYPPVPDDD